jgi:cold shock CspA family protein
MQGTVYTFDEQTHAGTVVLDSGRRLVFAPEVFAASGLRFLRPGQRVRITVSDDHISQLTIITLPMPGENQL